MWYYLCFIFFWTIVLTFIYIDVSFVIVILSAILTNVIIGFLMASQSHRYAFYKWLISLPVGIITFLIYKEIDFVYYWLNKIIPGYGKLSAGGSFALSVYMIFYFLSFLIAIFISGYITNKNIKKLTSSEL